MKKYFYSYLLLIISSYLFAQEENPKKIIRPFQTDHCTGWFDQSFSYDWSRCCVVHDLYFWAGGTEEQRKLADQNLKTCVEKEANSFHATLIYWGVKVGSFSPIKIQAKKWGNAWGDPHQYSAITKADLFKLRESLQKTLETNPELQNLLLRPDLDKFLVTLAELTENEEEKEDLSFKRSSR